MVFDFGKYQNLKLRDVIQNNLSYIIWCVENVDWFVLCENLFENIINIQNKDGMKLDSFEEINLKKLCFLNSINNYSHKIDYWDYDSSTDWLSAAAGTNDLEVMNDVFWNLD